MNSSRSTRSVMTDPVAEHFTLHVVCPNPAIDHLQIVETFEPFEVNRVIEVTSLPGGKGMIVARGARRIGANVAAYGFVGGLTGQAIREGCADSGVIDRHVSVSGSTRITPVVIERTTGRSTVLNERGPAVTPDDVNHLVSGLGDAVRPGDVVVTTGSLPPGSPDDLHAQIAAAALSRGARVLVDAHGPSLTAVVARLEDELNSPRLIVKPNALEFSQVIGRKLETADHIFDAISERFASTVASFAITMGADGAIWRSGSDTFVVKSPAVDVKNATGSGDSFLAGLAVGLGRGEEPHAAMRRGAAMGAANAVNVEPDVDPDVVETLLAHIEVESVRV